MHVGMPLKHTALLSEGMQLFYLEKAPVRKGKIKEFNEKREEGNTFNLSGLDLRAFDLRGLDTRGLNFVDSYMRNANLAGLDLRSCPMDGASFYGAHVSGTYFPHEIPAEEINMSIDRGTRIRSAI